MKRLAKTAVLLALAWGWGSFRGADASSLKLPPGARVAIVMFEDLQCPDWARAYPVVRDAADSHHIPLELLAFPLPKHNWAFQASVFAEFFDSRSPKLGNDYRGYISRNQSSVRDEGGLESYTKRFADENRVPLPSAIDAEGKLEEKVKADFGLGQKIGVEHTPTVFVIDRGGDSVPLVEAVDRTRLNQIIEDMQKKAGPVTPSKHTANRKKRTMPLLGRS